MLNIVIPMAGRGSRFSAQGYKTPKPFIPIHEKPMIQVVINNLKPLRPHRFIFLVLGDHLDEYDSRKRLSEWAGKNTEIIVVKEVTQGAACTVLLSKELINNDDELMIANSDQWVDLDINNYLEHQDKAHLDGLIMTMEATDPKWSFAKVESGLVTEVAEKKVISHEATVGIYNFKHGRDFVEAAEEMIRQDLRVNGEFYVAPTYNILVSQGRRIGIFNVGSENSGMYGLGIPEDLNHFLKLDVSIQATRF